MLIERVYNDLLSQASYIVACQESKLAIVVDPTRDVDRYIEFAARKNLTLAFVTETHIHADFVSGARDLARRTGAKLLLSAEGGKDWQYGFAASDEARLLHAGDVVELGRVRLDVWHTPGHTPEHLSFLVTDRATSEQPIGMLSGDFIFVGDVGRPDLLEHAAKHAGTKEPMARQLFRSLRSMDSLPDFLQLWPGHGPGSACGKSLGALPSTTLGYERLSNPALLANDEDAFVQDILSGQPEPPKYFAVMKATNRDGPPPARVNQDLAQLDVEALKRALESGAVIVDARASQDFASGHIPSAINIPMGNSFATWAGSLLPYDRQIVLMAEDRGRAGRARYVTTLIGLDRVIGWGGAALLDEWRNNEGDLATTNQIDVMTLNASPGRTVIDVRAASEWSDGHLPHASHHFLGDLAESTRDLPRDTPIALHCQGGSRSAIAASLLQANGFSNVVNVTGGYRAWRDAGLHVTSPSPITADKK